MKKIWICILIGLICTISQLCAENHFEINGLVYAIQDYDSTTVAVQSPSLCTQTRIRKSSNRTLRIPGTVSINGKTFKVSTITPYSFSGYHEMDSLIIEDGIETIDEYAFDNCMNLRTVYLPSSIRQINENPFTNCPRLETIKIKENNPVYNSSNNCNAIIHTKRHELISGCKNTTLPSTVQTIGNHAFEGCYQLESIQIPEGVEKISICGFAKCFNLKNINLPESLRHIGIAAFDGCESLRSIFISKNVNQIEFIPWSNCSNLSEIVVDKNNSTFDSRDNCNAIVRTQNNTLIAGCSQTIIPSSVIRIGSNAFTGIINMTHIDIPEGITEISPAAFNGCTSLVSINVNKNNKVYDSRNNCNAIIETATQTLVCGCGTTVIPKDIKVIGSQAFIGMILPETLNIPEGVSEIKPFAFEFCPTVKQVIIPGSVQHIGKRAFFCCRNLNKVVIESGTLDTIVHETFYGCSNLESVHLPENIKIIRDGAFADCYNLNHIVLPSMQTLVEPRAFEGCPFQTAIK